MERCRTEAPPRTAQPDGHWADCWLHQVGRADLIADTAMTAPTIQTPTEESA